MGELNLEPVPEDPVKKRRIAVGVAAAAVVALAISLFGGHWLAPADPLQGGMGLRGYKICFNDSCESRGNKELIDDWNESNRSDKKSPVFWVAGYVTLGAIVLAIALLGAAALLVSRGRFYLGRSLAPTGLALLLLFVALIAGMIFVATNPTKGTAIQLGVGWTFWLFGVGVVTGIVGAQMLNKFKPADFNL
jgi:amino acid transporter